ncbi:NAD-dependent aldehyde dehydrogenase [Desulfosporosinus orientis DSM 765]|uniref:Aldehyde dehydrogenase n=1 Tax=Desulfosporosinus orientis (strain ATCC 19365 / DSM 765 / NCIMB 8382 / VKM B-1628 / Singapore I) TaxID=768706 RepID=G7WJ16_DESOD|nr:aldehyde dehydrogenase [Desulfosporosinus orientis]AET69741.1 NAD-dependent aldehyde dehydrogenase [Desulfosporosinus orientis DSM 765]
MPSIIETLNNQRTFFNSGRTLDLNFRLNALKTLKKSIQENEKEILDALKTDLNKSAFEAYATEVGVVLEEIGYAIKNLPNWVKVKKVKTPIVHFKSSCYTISEPYGIALIMSPWNYPFQLTIAPLIGSIAGGNCSVVKPSAYSPATSAVMAKILGKSFAQNYITVIEGGREANRALLDEKFDYIFFTGGVSVGKTVMASASKHLTPVTLELGGKSPCIVDSEVNIDLAARRIVWGKFLNAGQTCVAPDYLLVHKKVKRELIDSMKKYIVEFYGRNPCKNKEFPKIINEKHFNRIIELLTNGEIIIGGESDEQSLHIAPTLIDLIKLEDPIMQEEIFGPVLPILEYSDISDVIALVKSRPKPLALYLFTTSKQLENRIVKSISFGGGCINDTIVHLGTSNMPFGGVGESGMGGYHGKWSFDTFTHTKSILKKSNSIDIKLRYPPYGNKLGILKKLLG